MNHGMIMPLLPAHQREAESLYRQRLTLLEKNAVPLSALHSLDTRLAGNLYALSLLDDQNDLRLPQRSPAATFVHLWVRLYRQPQATLAQLATEFEQLDANDHQAALHALHWRPAAHLARLTDIAQADSTLTTWPAALQAALLLTAAGTALSHTEPPKQGTPTPLSARRLQCLDAQPDTPCELFRPWYHHEAATVRNSALIAGLHRRDPQALDLLESEVSATETTARPGLPLITWLLASRQRPALMHAHPIMAGLSGHAAAGPTLLDGLEHPASSEAAAQGWFWLTGQTLPRRPRLQAVGSDAPADAPTLPDVDAARQWWAQHGWPDGQTQPPGGPGTHRTAQAGQITPLLAALAGLSQGHAHAALYRPLTLWFPALQEGV